VTATDFFPLRQLDKCKRRVNRLVYDEIHGLLSEADYRRDFIKLEKLAVVPIQKIYLSATIPIHLLQRLWNMLAAPPTTRTICAPFVQRNLHIHCVTLHPNNDRATFLELLLPHLAQQYMGDQGQGIVFLNAKQDVDNIHAHYISRGIDAVRSYANYGSWESNEELWMAGGARWIIATGTLIHGIDNANCVVVIVVDWDPGLIRLAQGWGRAGRKGQPGYAFLVASPQHPSACDAGR
jgi:superfamily II DNA helicase RecQ